MFNFVMAEHVAKFDRMNSQDIVDILGRKFITTAQCDSIAGALLEEFSELRMDYPLLAPDSIISMISKGNSKSYRHLKAFVESVFDETHSFCVSKPHVSGMCAL